MTNLTPTPGWDDVIQIETTTPLLGGPFGDLNKPAQALLNRTELLKQSGTILYTPPVPYIQPDSVQNMITKLLVLTGAIPQNPPVLNADFSNPAYF